MKAMDGSQLCIGPLDTDMTTIVHGVIFADRHTNSLYSEQP